MSKLVRAENGKMVRVDDSPVESVYPEDYLMLGKGAINMLGRGIWQTASKVAKKVLANKTKPKKPVGSVEAEPSLSNPRVSRKPYQPSTSSEPAYKRRLKESKSSKTTKPVERGNTVEQKQPSTATKETASSRDMPELEEALSTRAKRKSRAGLLKKAVIGGGGLAGTYAVLSDNNEQGSTTAGTYAEQGGGFPAFSGAGYRTGRIGEASDSPYLRLVGGSSDAFVDENGTVQRFRATDDSVNNALRSKLAEEQGTRGRLTASVLPSVYSGAQSNDYEPDNQQVGESDDVRSAILRRGMELLEKANTTDQLNAVTNLLAQAGASARRETVKQESPLDTRRKELNVALAQARLDSLQSKQPRPRDTYGYGAMLKNVIKSDPVDAENVAATLGLTPDTAPTLYVNDNGEFVLDKSKLYKLLLRAKTGNVPPDRLVDVL